MKYQISRHAMERYANRIMDKDNKSDVNVFISNHAQKINEDITKMIEYGDLLYEGRSIKKEWQNAIVQIIMRDNWIVILDKNKQNVVTLFSLDLGVGEEMNQLYRTKLLEKLQAAKDKFQEACKQIDIQEQTYKGLIQDNIDTITEYKKIVKSLEEQNQNYTGVIAELNTHRDLAEREVREIIGILTAKNIF